MAQPTLQEIDEAISTLTSAGMLLNAEQTIAVNRVRSEMKQQQEEAVRAAEAKRLQEQEAKRRAQQEYQLQLERQRAIEKAQAESAHLDINRPPEELYYFEKRPVEGLWEIFKQPWLHKTFKKHLCDSGMRETLCSSYMSHFEYKIRQIDSDKVYRNAVEKCLTISSLRKTIDTFLLTWGDEKRFAWRKQFFNDYLTFLTYVIFRSELRDSFRKAAPSPALMQSATGAHSASAPTTVAAAINRDSKTKRIRIFYSGNKIEVLDPFAALCQVIRQVGVGDVKDLNIHAGPSFLRLLRIGAPTNNVNYKHLEGGYWIKSNCTPDETIDVIRQIIKKSGTSRILSVQLVSND